jgi:chaperone modulatory protein CbpM
MRLDAVIALFGDLRALEITSWIERGWIEPDRAGEDWEFHEIDVARIRLIRDLRQGMDVGEEAIPIILSLLDQVYELRGQLRSLLSAVERQPEAVRAAIVAARR